MLMPGSLTADKRKLKEWKNIHCTDFTCAEGWGSGAWLKKANLRWPGWAKTLLAGRRGDESCSTE